MIKFTFILVLFSDLFSQVGVDQLIENVMLGKTQESITALPGLESQYPNNPSIMYLGALLESDGDKAREKYELIYKNHPNSEYADDAVMKIAEYYYAAGLYIKSSEWTKRMARYYARSEHIERAVKLFLNSLIVSGSKDTAYYYSKVFKKQFPKMDVDKKLSELLNELESKPKEDNKVENKPKEQSTEVNTIQEDKKKNSGILDRIVETLSSPVPDEITLPESFSKLTTQTKQPFSLQVGAYGEEKNANDQKELLYMAGYSTRIDLKERNGRTLYLVRIGYYADKVAAKAAARELKTRLDINTMIISNE